MLALALVALGVGVAGIVALRWAARLRAAGALKVLCSLSFVVLACVREHPEPHYTGCMLAGLVLSALGDSILLLRNRVGLAVGASAFGLAHVAYVVAWWRLLVPSWPVIATAVLGLLLVGYVTYATRARTGSMRWVVLGYGGVLTVSVVCALAAGVQSGGALAWVLGCGGVLFMISDVSVLRDRLLTPSLWNPTWGLPCYYAAQVLFALSVAMVGAG